MIWWKRYSLYSVCEIPKGEKLWDSFRTDSLLFYFLFIGLYVYIPITCYFLLKKSWRRRRKVKKTNINRLKIIKPEPQNDGWKKYWAVRIAPAVNLFWNIFQPLFFTVSSSPSHCIRVFFSFILSSFLLFLSLCYVQSRRPRFII